MSFEEFRATVSAPVPPAGLSGPLQALWLAARGNWAGAHACAQDDTGPDGFWVHAYLHRKEGDIGNAGYWYARAGRPMPPESLMFDVEWAAIARELLGG